MSGKVHLRYAIEGFIDDLEKSVFEKLVFLYLCPPTLLVPVISYLHGSGPPGGPATDVRLGEPRHLDLFFPFRKVKNVEEWELGSRQLHVQLESPQQANSDLLEQQLNWLTDSFLLSRLPRN